MVRVSLKKNYLLNVGLTTSVAILIVKLLSTLLVYHFFTFDKYLAVVAVVFLLAGHFLFPRKLIAGDSPKQIVSPEIILLRQSEYPELRGIRYSLTNRELVIFRHLAEGKTNKEMAITLGVQVSTIKTHINNLFVKINCKNRKEAVEKWDQMVKNHFIS
jgi:DNA-binding CsgD family transcriptional regulator